MFVYIALCYFINAIKPYQLWKYIASYTVRPLAFMQQAVISVNEDVHTHWGLCTCKRIHYVFVSTAGILTAMQPN